MATDFLAPTPQSDPLDLSLLPPIFLSKTHLDQDDLHDFEDQILEAHGNLTYDITEAKIVLSKAERKRRIELDLRSEGLFTEQVTEEDKEPLREDSGVTLPSAKRRKLSHLDGDSLIGRDVVVIDDEDSTDSEHEGETKAKLGSIKLESQALSQHVLSIGEKLCMQLSKETIHVINLQWFEDCLKAATLLPIEIYLTYEGRIIEKPLATGRSAASGTITIRQSPRTILERAKADAPPPNHFSHGYRGKVYAQSSDANPANASYSRGGANTLDKTKYAHLLHETTSEYEGNISSDIPEMPDWVKQGVKYACERCTPPESPNHDFIEQLKKIKLARLLTKDEIGVRAYSTSIAAIAAYPHKISNPREIMHLPGCDTKIANLYIDYVNTGKVQPAEDAENDEDLKILRLFYDIWGVGATTARDFYFNRGWRDLDDIVEFGWSTLSRVQQIGVKYSTEFLDPIPRKEVEEIAAIITRHARKVRDKRIQTLVVGGYRRGKEACGDVDIIVSHPDEAQTLHIVNDIVASLEEEGWITHTLLLSLTSSNRGQQTLPFKISEAGGGFDTLDKALVVWQDPVWPTKEADLADNAKFKNPNIHRRVDIIISPWRTVGCAVAGWSGGTTFQRDLRRYAKNVKGWKFDSSGVRDRGSGQVVDVEGYEDEQSRATTMEEAERRVFAGFGLTYREPWERCTG